MRRRFFLFFAVVSLVLAAACSAMVLLSMSLQPSLRAFRAEAWGAALGFCLLQFAMPLAHRLLRWRLPLLAWINYLLLSLASTYLPVLVAASLAALLLRGVAGREAGPVAFGAAVGLTLLSCAVGMIQAYRPARVRRVAVPIEGLPAALDGFRILQISDLHLGPMLSPERVQRLVSNANGLEPDLIAVTGDLADGDVAQERACLDALGGLRARDGVCFVTGNHEYYSGAGPWIEAVQALGWTVLDNGHRVLERADARMVVAGMPDPTAGRERGPDLARALAGAPEPSTKLLLFHPPTGTRRAAEAGVHLQLSGHTHGGQYFPWSLVVRAIFDHPLGLGREGAMWIYTSPGSGFWGPPNRFLVPPEITLLELKTAPYLPASTGSV